MFISKAKLQLLVHAGYDRGLTKGYDLAWQMRQIEALNRSSLGALTAEEERDLEEILNRSTKGLVMTPKLEKELDELLKKSKQ